MISAKFWSVLVVLSVLSAASAIRYFPNDAVWFEDVTNATLDSESKQIIDWLTERGGWGKYLTGRIFPDSINLFASINSVITRIPQV